MFLQEHFKNMYLKLFGFIEMNIVKKSFLFIGIYFLSQINA
jgi:hypothetical protein